ncbi:MAG: hypothetical protein ACRD9Q_04485 [Nitrososphaeraceae archaeon]
MSTYCKMREYRSKNHRKPVMMYRSKAISTVLTTMIILVASVVLGVGIVIYGTSLFKTGTQQEVIVIRGVTLWVNATNTTATPPNIAGVAWGAAGVRNSGDKLVSVDTIILRGAFIPFTQWYYDKSQTRVTIETFQDRYQITTMNTFNGTLNNGPGPLDPVDCPNDWDIYIDFDGTGGKPTICLTQASGPISLNPGERMMVYFRANAGLILPIDSGTSTNVSIFAGKTGAPLTTVITTP